MSSDRLDRVLARLASPSGGPGTAKLCAIGAEITAATGAGIMLMVDNHPQGSLCTTDEVSALIEELQYTLGEGPCVDAHRRGGPVDEPDLANPAVVRWAAFSRSAVDAGARAVFGFPVAVGGVGLGALNLYRDRPGPLTDDQHADAVVLAGVVGEAIIGLQADAAPGTLAVELEAVGNYRLVVHQAAGMVSVQLGVAVADALLRLRAHAFTTSRSVVDVANDVVARRLRFEE